VGFEGILIMVGWLWYMDVTNCFLKLGFRNMLLWDVSGLACMIFGNLV